ncbi:unnamed protein product (plasmid) [Mycetohabitans rhizoxinica HKI 454]|uniref:Uncharacterized protein n=2 Tax=Mycetohabitans rhizoxinica TaxID=412963 RepID=E5AUE5_MYCRK|nr:MULTISPECIES: hypothetical protein [Mycetohabitans]MCF7695964.1 hypothetical protein [Mycetohabitans sp. B2]MCG1048498.1 hypothetical protein [Mycetohabitans sp. B6]CBW76719.1 unnamed protein product [Mycetohabitans rhizoxinica HKI 454]
MGYTIRTFLITPDEGILKIGMTRYWNMLGAPDSHRLPEFADQRVRLAHLDGSQAHALDQSGFCDCHF